jgi:hypothetical protein
MKILIVDDEQDRCDILADEYSRQYLGAEHPATGRVRVDGELVHSACGAIATLRTEVYDVVCLDFDLGDSPDAIMNRRPELTGDVVVSAILLDPHISRPGHVRVHSLSIGRGYAMVTRLRAGGVSAEYRPIW